MYSKRFLSFPDSIRHYLVSNLCTLAPIIYPSIKQPLLFINHLHIVIRQEFNEFDNRESMESFSILAYHVLFIRSSYIDRSYSTNTFRSRVLSPTDWIVTKQTRAWRELHSSKYLGNFPESYERAWKSSIWLSYHSSIDYSPSIRSTDSLWWISLFLLRSSRFLLENHSPHPFHSRIPLKMRKLHFFIDESYEFIVFFRDSHSR